LKTEQIARIEARHQGRQLLNAQPHKPHSHARGIMIMTNAIYSSFVRTFSENKRTKGALRRKGIVS
jgi:hypothetical protein